MMLEARSAWIAATHTLIAMGLGVWAPGCGSQGTDHELIASHYYLWSASSGDYEIHFVGNPYAVLYECSGDTKRSFQEDGALRFIAGPTVSALEVREGHIFAKVVDWREGSLIEYVAIDLATDCIYRFPSRGELDVFLEARSITLPRVLRHI